MELTAVAGVRLKATTPPTTPPTKVTAPRSTYDAQGSEDPVGGFGKLVRKDDQAPTGDKAVDAAHDNAKLVHDFYAEVLGRDSIDGKGMEMKSVVHYGDQYNNAYWDGEKMTYGDGDGELLGPLSGSLDVVGHEMTHGVTEHTAGLNYEGQSGALNESWSDVFGELIEQWSDNRAGFGTVDAAKAADWLIGEDVFTPKIKGDALRSMRAPGTAYDTKEWGKDDQPAHMKDYYKGSQDNYGVHINSGIPNKAAYEIGVKLGSEKLAKVWYDALTTSLGPDSDFSDAAAATIASAAKLYGAGEVPNAVADAWKGVGVVPATTAPKPAPAGTPSRSHQHGEAGDGIVPPWLATPGTFSK
ncbi:MAG: family peptidase [Thermoleophilia bacterium]|nr:family peptidase [Thermoleophilia bacterium]